MNLSTSMIRKRMADRFDRGKGLFGRKVAKTAWLRDTGYFVPDQASEFVRRVPPAREEMARILGVTVEQLPAFHTGRSGLFDCDNYAGLGTSIIKALWARDHHGKPIEELSVWTMARADIDHTQGLALHGGGFLIIEWITGEIVDVDAVNPEVYLIG